MSTTTTTTRLRDKPTKFEGAMVRKSERSSRDRALEEVSADNAGGASLELFDDSKNRPARPPFVPEAHGLSRDFRLTKYGDLRARGTRPDRHVVDSFLSLFREDRQVEDDGDTKPTDVRTMVLDEEALCSRIERFDLQFIETSNTVSPLIDDPYAMGRIACLSVLSGIYALGIVELATTRMTLAIPNRMEATERDVVVPMIIRGYRDAAVESGGIVESSRITMNPWCLVGGSASAICTRYEFVPPDGATLGDVIVLTKPLGTAVALTAVQWMETPERRNRLLLTIDEEEARKAGQRAVDSMLRSNREAAVLMRKYNAHAACDVSSYGILGHAEMLARRQKSPVNFVIHNLPIIARMTAASRITGNAVQLLRGVMPEYSGGLMLVLPREQAAAYCKTLDRIDNRQAWIVGLVEPGERTARVIDRPRVIEVPAKETDNSLF